MISRLVATLAFLVAVTALLGWSDDGRAASFDCKKAAHPLEKIICANPEISDKDDQVATLYRARLAQVFDKVGFKRSQREWQSWLRGKCAVGCDAATVTKAYNVRLGSLEENYSESWSANYKTADVLELGILYFNDAPKDVSFSLQRRRVDDEDGTPPLCEFPPSDEMAEMAFATIVSPTLARFTERGCSIDFKLTRQKDGNVVGIETVASKGCMSYCKRSTLGLSDNFTPDGGADNSIYESAPE